MTGAAREMTLDEYVGVLAGNHIAKGELNELKQKVAEAETWRKKKDVNYAAAMKERNEARALVAEIMTKYLPCECCGEPGVILYDIQGEGYYWLCDRLDGDHDEEHYSGVEIARVKKWT